MGHLVWLISALIFLPIIVDCLKIDWIVVGAAAATITALVVVPRFLDACCPNAPREGSNFSIAVFLLLIAFFVALIAVARDKDKDY